MAALALAVAPWAVRNAATEHVGGAYPSSSLVGQNAWVAVHWNPTGRVTRGVDVPPYPPVPGAKTEADVDGGIRTAARRELFAHPRRYARAALQKARFMWPAWVPGYSPIRNLSEAWLTLLAMIFLGGFAFSARVRSGGSWWALLAGILTAGAVATYVDFDLRYRLPLLVAVIPSAAATLVTLHERRRGSE